METLTPIPPVRKPTGLLRGQAAKVARKHRCSITYVLMVARGERRGRPAVLRTIEAYRQRNQQEQSSPQSSAA